MKRLTALLAGAALALLALVPLARAEEFGLEAGSFTAGSFQGDGTGIFGAGAGPDTRAGGHPFQATTSFTLDHHLVTVGGKTFPAPDGGSARNVVVKLPPGFLGDPFATPQCAQAALVQNGFCPNDTAIGVAHIRFALNLIPREERSYYLPVYNMVPSQGEPALFAFYNLDPSQLIPIHLRLDPSRGYAVTASVSNISSLGLVWRSELTIWGVPADSSHDPYRGLFEEGGGAGSAGGQSLHGPGCIVVSEANGGPTAGKSCPSDAPLRPLLSDPAACQGNPLQTGLSIDAWAQPGRRDAEGEPVLSDPAWSSADALSPAPTGCSALRFGGPEAPASFTFRPAVPAADTPSAYEARLNLPYNENPGGLANPTLRDTTVTLPEGVVVNPSSANGLGACTSAQVGLTSAIGATPIRFDGKAAQCPNASKIGTVEVHSPLVDHPLQGAVDLAKQGDNPFGSLLAVYIVVEDPETGIVVKLAGQVTPDPQTGRLTATFDENPQLPFTELDLRFFGGPQASLTNPATCGAKTTTSVLTPWSAPYTPPVTSTDSFQIDSGPNGTRCANKEAEEPNSPSFEAGTVTPIAGSYSPFVLRLAREDGSQQLQGLDLTLPPGLTGRLAGVPYCPEAAIALAKSREGKAGTGTLEQAAPSCPAASQVGSVNIGAGAGPDPFYVQGKAYLAGPYKGAPLSLVIITPAVAGPFDLGVVVVRSALFVDPSTAQIHAVSDPIPHILQGIPLDVRSVTVDLKRSDFTLNPTNCEKKSITGSVGTVQGQSAALSNPFQVGGCKQLGFHPNLKISLKGGTKRHSFPALKAVLTYPKGAYANIAKAQVTLPHSSFLEQGHIKTVCTRPQLASQTCPAASIYGHATAVSPLLDKPLSGPVYLGVGFGHELPDLVAELNGQIRVLLNGKVDTGKEDGLRNSFEMVPDAPVSKFTLEMFGGKKSLIVNSENLCSPKAKTKAVADFTGQNGKIYDTTPTVANSCGKKSKKGKKGKKGAKKSSAGRVGGSHR